MSTRCPGTPCEVRFEALVELLDVEAGLLEIGLGVTGRAGYESTTEVPNGAAGEIVAAEPRLMTAAPTPAPSE